MQTSKRVLVIGLDGATWDVLDPWIRDGTLPHLGRLRASGGWGALYSSIPPITAAAWSTFMTGKRPGKHGVYHFVKLFDNNGSSDSETELVSARSLKSSTLWDVMGHHERRVVLVNIPLTYPPRPVNGVMVTGLLTPKNAPTFTYPPELSREITDYKIDLDRYIDKKPFVDTFEDEITAPSLALVDEFLDMEQKRAELTFSLMDTEPWDFFMVVFTATDRMGHYLWPYHRSPQANDNPETQQLCQSVKNFYQRLDEIVGKLVERAGPEANIMVMSDHGMGPTHTYQFYCNYWLHQRGWLATRSDQAQLKNPDGWLKRLGLPRDKIARLVHHIPGLAQNKLVRKAAKRRSAAVDPERSKAYCVPIFYNILGIRVNLLDEEKRAFCDEIMRQLQELVDATTAKPVVRQVFRARDYYDSPNGDNLPDIIAVLDPDYGCNYHLGNYSSVVGKRLVISGPAKHRIEGIFIARGPDIASQAEALSNMNIEDIAPTVLYLMGLPVPMDLDGRVLTEVLDPHLLAQRPIEHVEPIGFWPQAEEAVFSDEVMTAEDEALIRDRLRSLGYFE